MIHPVIIHMVRVRLFFMEHRILKIEIVRIVCPIRKRLRRKTHRQYTLTILPPFLIPYARVTFSGLSRAIPLHLAGSDSDLVLNTLSADDHRTFALHFGRVTDRSPGWNIKIARWMIGVGKPAIQNQSVSVFKRSGPEKHPWESFVQLASEFCDRMESIGQIRVVLESEQAIWTHARLTYAGMGLGP
jgi:hypothetical protein